MDVDGGQEQEIEAPHREADGNRYREIVVDEVTAGIARLLSPSLPQGSV